MLVFRFVGMPRLEPPAEQFIVLHHGSAILHRRRWLLDSGNGSNMNVIQCQTIIWFIGLWKDCWHNLSRQGCLRATDPKSRGALLCILAVRILQICACQRLVSHWISCLQCSMMPCAYGRLQLTACKVDEAHCASHRADQIEARCFDHFDPLVTFLHDRKTIWVQCCALRGWSCQAVCSVLANESTWWPARPPPRAAACLLCLMIHLWSLWTPYRILCLFNRVTERDQVGQCSVHAFHHVVWCFQFLLWSCIAPSSRLRRVSTMCLRLGQPLNSLLSHFVCSCDPGFEEHRSDKNRPRRCVSFEFFW